MSGLSLVELVKRFPDEQAATEWLESERWPDGDRFFPHCGCFGGVCDVPNAKPMPYRCSECKRYFSLRTGTVMERSPIPLHKWLVGAFLMIRGKGVSSLQLARDLGITQRSAWFMGHRLRYAMKSDCGMFAGTVEVDEVYLGGKNKNRHKAKKLPGRGSSGKTPVVGIKDRETNRIFAAPVASVNRETVEDLVGEHVAGGSNVYTDQSSVYDRVDCHVSINHSRGEYVRDDMHTNGIGASGELRRAHGGVSH